MSNWLLMHLWQRAPVVMLLVAIPDVVGAGPTWLQAQADRQIRLVASTEKGALLFQNRCATCHAAQEVGPEKFGPNLRGVFGQQAGSLPGYNYSADLRNSRVIWNAQSLDEYLTDPHRGRRAETKCHIRVYPVKLTATTSSSTLSKRRDKQGFCG